MLATGDTVLARHALASLPPTPTTGTWITYIRCHDDIGWAIDDRDAAAVGMNGHEHRRFLADWYAGDFPGSWADGLVFQHNPATGDKRISGTAASLAGLEDDEEAGLARLFLAHAVVAGWGGIPVIWSGDELGQPNDPGWAAEPGHEDDNRWAHRPRLDWERAGLRDDLRTVPGKVFAGRRPPGPGPRRAAPAARVRIQPGAPRHRRPGSSPTVREHPSGPMVCLYNVTGRAAAVPDRPAARRRPRRAVRRAGRVRGDGRRRRPGLAAAVRRVVGRRRTPIIGRCDPGHGAQHPAGRGSRAVWTPRLPSIR